MDFCPNCGANTGGLIDHCDCCGFKLTNNKNLFVAKIHEFIGSSDVGTIIVNSVKELNIHFSKEMFPNINRIVIQTYCYPCYLIDEMKLRNQIRINKKKREAVVTIVFAYEEQVLSSQFHKKKNEVVAVLQNSLIYLFRKLHHPNEQELVAITKMVMNGTGDGSLSYDIISIYWNHSDQSFHKFFFSITAGFVGGYFGYWD